MENKKVFEIKNKKKKEKIEHAESKKLNKFKKTIRDIYIVCKNKDTKNQILTQKLLPNDFLERDINKILISINSIDRNRSKTSIETRYQECEYDFAPYKFYHDLTVASSQLIKKCPFKSKDYKNIDEFYTFCVNLLIRELTRLKIVLEDNSSETKGSELESIVLKEFEHALSDYKVRNNETLSYLYMVNNNDNGPANINLNLNVSSSQKIVFLPFFSSLINRSVLDTSVENFTMPFSIAKVVPTNKNSNMSESTLKNISPANQKIPTPFDQPSSSFLQNFFHPLWNNLLLPNWLNYVYDESNFFQSTSKSQNKNKVTQEDNVNFYNSFAFNSDLNGSFLSECLKNRIWFHQSGNSMIFNLDDSKKNICKTAKIVDPKDLHSNEISDDEKKNTNLDFNMNDNDLTNNIYVNKIEDYLESNQVLIGDSDNEINILNLLKWDPNIMSEFELFKQESQLLISSPCQFQKNITNNVLELNNLRQKRYLYSDLRNVQFPSAEEIRMYNRISISISFLINNFNINPNKLLNHSDMVPVLRSEYNGNSPSITMNKKVMNPSTTVKYGRLPSIRGHYKKRKLLNVDNSI